MDFDRCTTVTKGKCVVVQEKKSRFELINKKGLEVKKVQVDGCLIRDHREKCDWIISLEAPTKRAMFIELKGKDIDKAISQLKATLSHTKSKYDQYQRECYAVTTRIPKHGTTTRRKCMDFHKATKTTLSIKNLRITVEV